MGKQTNAIPSNVSFGSLSEFDLTAEDIYAILLRHGDEHNDGRLAAALIANGGQVEAQLAVRTHRPARPGWKPAEVVVGAQITAEVPGLPGAWLTSAPVVLQSTGRGPMTNRLLKRSTSLGVVRSRGETRSVAALSRGLEHTLTRGSLMMRGYVSTSFDRDERDLLEAAVGRLNPVLLGRVAHPGAKEVAAAEAAANGAEEEAPQTERRAIYARAGLTIPGGVGGSLEVGRSYEIVRVRVA